MKVYVQKTSQKNQVSGYAGLDSSGKVATAQLPVSSWRDPVATLVDLPPTGNTDGDARIVLSEHVLYLWNSTTAAWSALGTAATPGGGGDGGDDLDVPIVAADLAGLGIGDQAGREGIIRIGTYPDDYSEEFVWSGTRWEGTREIEITAQNDTWGMDLSNVSPANMVTFRRPTSALPYGKHHTYLQNAATVGDANVTPSDASDMLVVPFNIRNYTVTPTGFTAGHFSGCTWARTDGTANGTEVFPATITPVTQEAQIGGYGTVAAPVDRVGQMFAAGFSLEERASAFMNGSQDGKALQLSVYYVNVDANEDFDLPALVPSGGLGNGVVLTGPPSTLGAANRADERGFQMVTVGYTAWQAATPTKRYLIPVVVARMAAGAQDNGEFYNYCHKLRWVGQ